MNKQNSRLTTRRIVTAVLFPLFLLLILLSTGTLTKDKPIPPAENPIIKELPKTPPSKKEPKKSYDDDYRNKYDPYDYTNLDNLGDDPYSPPKKDKPETDKDKGKDDGKDDGDDKPGDNGKDPDDETPPKEEDPKDKNKGPLKTTTDTLADTLDRVVPGTGPLVKDTTKGLDPLLDPLDKTLKPLNPITDPANDLLNGLTDTLLPKAPKKP